MTETAISHELSSAEQGPGVGHLLEIKDLRVSFRSRLGEVRAVRGVDLAVDAGQTLGIVGESGSGKSVTVRAVMGILPERTSGTSGQILFNGRDLLRTPTKARRAMLGRDLAMVFQDPMRSLNPTMQVGHQVVEAIKNHSALDNAGARDRAVELLRMVRISAPEMRYSQFPHQLSGGMRQRVMIAMAIACRPKLLIADEPTTALDVTTQAEIMDLLRDLQAELNMGLILVSHDLGLTSQYAHRLAVMYAGRIVESGDTAELFSRPRMPYTDALLRSAPRLGSGAGRLETIPGDPPDPLIIRPGCPFSPRCERADAQCFEESPPISLEHGHSFFCWHPLTHGDESLPADASRLGGPTPGPESDPNGTTSPLLEVRNIYQEFSLGIRGARGAKVQAVAGVSLDIHEGETLGLVGETGCGKSTLARAILQVPPPTAGEILLDGKNLADLRGQQLREARRHVQMVSQDPFSSLDRRWSVAELIEEPLNNFKIGNPGSRRARALELMEQCGLQPDRFAKRRPRQLSGGQCQRVAIARALSISPRLVICDEPVSSLDVSVQGQIINLLEDLRDQLNLSYLFIAHDLAVVEHISDRIAVMYLGQIVEAGPAAELCPSPHHHYTAALLAAAPEVNEPDAQTSRSRFQRAEANADIPSPVNPPSGCRFHTRCPRAEAHCTEEVPPLRQISPGRWVACHYPLGGEHAAPSTAPVGTAS